MAKAINVANNTVSAKDDALFYNCLTGKSGVFHYGNEMDYTVVSANQFRVKDGIAEVQGRNYIIYPSETVDIEVENGTQSMNRYDIIALQFTKSGDVESMELVCIKGTESSGTPSDPTLVQDDTLVSGSTYQMPLYRLRLSGIAVDGVDDLREYIPSLSKVLVFVSESTGYITVDVLED